MEPLRRAFEHEEHRAKTEHGEDVRRQHDEGILRDRENRRNRIDREDHVGDRDQQHDDEERRIEPLAGFDDAERGAAERSRQREMALDEAQGRIRFEIRLIVRVAQHPDAGEHEEQSEKIKNPVEPRDERSADEDQDRAQDDRAEHSQHQRAPALFGRHREVVEDHQEHENVVDRERLLDDVAGQELESDLVRDRAAGVRVEPPPEPEVEHERERYPRDAPEKRVAERDAARTAGAQDQEIDRERRDHDGDECRPEPRCSDRLHCALRKRETP
jgi:hypothetical protein